MAELRKWYEVYLVIWFLVAVIAVSWSATRGDLGPLRQLLTEALLAGAVYAVFALVTRARDHKPQPRRNDAP